MPKKDRKKTRNPFGSITPVRVRVDGRLVDRWDAKKRYTAADGAAGQKFKRCRSSSEAETALINFRNEIEREQDGDGHDRHTFGQLCDYFLAEYVKPPVFVGNRQLSGYRQDLKTLKTYIADYRAFLGDDKQVKKITYDDLRRYAEHVATTPVNVGRKNEGPPSPATVNRKLAWLRRIFNVAIQIGWLEKSPFKNGKRLIEPDAEEPRERVLSFDEEERLLARCEGPDEYEYRRGERVVKVSREVNPRIHLRPAVIFAIESGMRKKEMFTTRVDQLDFKKLRIELNAKQTKALKRRTIPLSDRLAAELLTLIAAQRLRPSDLIFGGAKDFDRAFATACRRAGIEDLTFHDLRHTASTWMDEAGISDPARRNMVGHADRRTGQRYVNPTDDVLDSSRVKMNEFREKLEERRRAAAG